MRKRADLYSIVDSDLSNRRIVYHDETEFLRYSDAYHSRNELLKIRYLFFGVVLCVMLILIFMVLNRYDNYASYIKIEGIQETEICIKTSSEDFIGQNYLLVIEEVKAMGFANVLAIPKKDLIIGLFRHPGTVSRISIAGNPNFHPNEAYHQEAKVIIEYHDR